MTFECYGRHFKRGLRKLRIQKVTIKQQLYSACCVMTYGPCFQVHLVSFVHDGTRLAAVLLHKLPLCTLWMKLSLTPKLIAFAAVLKFA